MARATTPPKEWARIRTGWRWLRTGAQRRQDPDRRGDLLPARGLLHAPRHALRLRAAEGTHPIVYPGRNAHGIYHNTQSAAQTCCYWEDHRDGDGPWLDTWIAPLRRMRPVAQGGEPWMDADLAGTFSWGVGTHPTQSTSGDCGQQTCAGTSTWGCHESGCWRSQCEVGDRDDGVTCWHCPPGYSEWVFACTKCDCGGCSTTSVETYGLRYTISTTDAGLMYQAP